MTTLAAAAAEIAAAADFGTPSARKSGRSPKWPYVAVIVYHDGSIRRQHTETIRGLAFATREEAVTYARRVIDAARSRLERELQERRFRALREQYGLPREIEEFST